MFFTWLAVALAAHLQTGQSRTVLASVVDPRNRPFVDVGPDDFVVSEAGQPREVLSVRMADYPIVLLIDNSSDGRRDLDAMKKAATRFLARIGRRPFAVGTLADPPSMVTSFDDGRPATLRAIGSIEGKPMGATLLGGIAAAARTLHDLGAPFSAIVVLSSTPADAGRDSPQDLLRTILQSQAYVHAIAIRSLQTFGRFEPLRGLTEQTRGQFTTIYASASYEIALDHLADRLAAEMMIEYLVPAGSTASDVKLGVNLPGAKISGLGVR